MTAAVADPRDLVQLLQRWQRDPVATYCTWFRWEERIKNFRSIRRGLQAVVQVQAFLDERLAQTTEHGREVMYGGDEVLVLALDVAGRRDAVQLVGSLVERVGSS